MFAPSSNGFTRYGEADVLSMTIGTPASFAIGTTSSNGKTSQRGLPIVSPKMSFVLSVMASRKFSGRLGSTNFTVMPILGRV